MRPWWNRQTRYFEGVVTSVVCVQVASASPFEKATERKFRFFSYIRNYFENLSIWMIRSSHEKERTVSDAVDRVYPQAAAEPERRSILRIKRGSQGKKRASISNRTGSSLLMISKKFRNYMFTSVARIWRNWIQLPLLAALHLNALSRTAFFNLLHDLKETSSGVSSIHAGGFLFFRQRMRRRESSSMERFRKTCLETRPILKYSTCLISIFPQNRSAGSKTAGGSSVSKNDPSAFLSFFSPIPPSVFTQS